MPSSIQFDAPGLTGTGSDDHSQMSPDTVEGRYRGERVVQITNQSSLLQDAAEELTFQFGETQEKTLAKRTIEEEDLKEDKHQDADDIKHVQQVMGKLEDMHKSILDRVLQIMMRMRAADASELRNQIREQLPEPAHQYAALLALVAKLHEQDAPAVQIQAAKTALQQLKQEYGSAIRAALNIAEVVTEFTGAQLGDVQTLRNTYRDTVLDHQDLAQTFGKLIDQYGDAELPQAIQYLVKALGADLAADGASIDRNKLNAVLNDLYRLEVLTGLLEDCDMLVMRNRGPDILCRGSELLKEVLDLQKNQWLRADLIAPLLAKLGLRKVTGEINFLREFKELARMIPLKAYAEPEQRSRLLDTIQQAMDTAIEREEDELA